MTQTPPLFQEALQDTTQAADSTTAVLADTLIAITEPAGALTAVADAGELISSGRWREVGVHFFEGAVDIVISFVPKLLSALFILFLLYILFRISRRLLDQLFDRSSFIEAGLGGLMIKTYSVAAWVFIGIMVLAQFGINVTALLAGLSVVGIAVGLAAQDTLQNFMSGITILIDRPFRVGHYINIDGTYGKIEEITLRSTRLRTLNNEMMVMPNSQMINQKLINHTQLGFLRVEVPFGIAYKEYPLKVRKIVLKLTDGDERLHPNSTTDVVVTALNDSSVDMQLRFHIKDAGLAFPIRREYTEKIREALRKADIEIPFPHLQLFIDEAKAFNETPSWPQKDNNFDPKNPSA